MAKVGFSRKPWDRKQDEIRTIEQNRQTFEKELRTNKIWAKRKSFKINRYTQIWSKHKKNKERIISDLILNSLSVCDACGDINETLERGLSMKEAGINIETVENMVYVIYMTKLAELLCSAKGANLSKTTTDKVIPLLIPYFIKAMDDQASRERGDRIIDGIHAIRSSLSKTNK